MEVRRVACARNARDEEGPFVSVAMIFSMAVCFGIPLMALVYFLVRDKRCAVAFALGVAGFFVSQAVLRMPLLGLVSQMPWFSVFMLTSPLAYAFVLALSAALFEEPARYVLLRTRRPLPFSLAIPVAYGLGHGGLEAAMVGASLLVMPAAGDASYLLAGIERLSTIMVHAALSVMVYVAVKRRSAAPFLGAVALHTLINMASFLPTFLGVSVVMFEVVYLLAAIALLVFTVPWARARAASADGQARVVEG